MKIRKAIKYDDVISIKYESESNNILEKVYNSDHGYDIKSSVIEEIIISPGQWKTINTGITLDLPEKVEAQIRSRSGLASKYGITVLNSPGTIDPGYRGKIKVILVNHGKNDYVVRKGDRIAQVIFNRITEVDLIRVNEIDKITDRGSEGIGSSGTESHPCRK